MGLGAGRWVRPAAGRVGLGARRAGEAHQQRDQRSNHPHGQRAANKEADGDDAMAAEEGRAVDPHARERAEDLEHVTGDTRSKEGRGAGGRWCWVCGDKQVWHVSSLAVHPGLASRQVRTAQTAAPSHATWSGSRRPASEHGGAG